jgi:hypothetical protein
MLSCVGRISCPFLKLDLAQGHHGSSGRRLPSVGIGPVSASTGRWKSRSLEGRPKIAADLRALIRQMSAENPLWGAPRINCELLKLGFEIAQSSVAAIEPASLDSS